MIRWFAQALRSAEVADAGSILKKLVGAMIFDEDLTEDERLFFFLDPTLRDYGRRLAPEYFLRDGAKDIYASVSMNDGDTVYIGTDGRPVAQNIKDMFDGKDADMTDDEKRAVNPSFGAVVNNKNTSIFYGFMTVKRGLTFVFKTADPPPVGGKVKPGAECAIVSYMREHVDNIQYLGTILSGAIGNDLYLNDDVQKFMLGKDNKFHLSTKDAGVESKSKAVNASRICCLTDLVLRFMDLRRVGGLRWFYRVIEAAMSGHRGTYKVSKAGTKKKSLKE